MREKSIARLGDVMFYLGGAVWGAYAVAKYAMGWNVTIRQFLPFHLGAIIPGIILRHGSARIARFIGNKGPDINV